MQNVFVYMSLMKWMNVKLSIIYEIILEPIQNPFWFQHGLASSLTGGDSTNIRCWLTDRCFPMNLSKSLRRWGGQVRGPGAELKCILNFLAPTVQLSQILTIMARCSNFSQINLLKIRLWPVPGHSQQAWPWQWAQVLTNQRPVEARGGQ